MNAHDAHAGRANTSAAWALLNTLARDGERHVVLSPGARSAPLVLAADAHPNLRVHVVLDERAAGFVALGLAVATGRAAVLACTSGSAGGHYLPAVMEAHHSHVPLIVITADRPEELQHSGSAQTTEQDSLFARHVRGSRRLPCPRGQGPQQAAIEAAWRLQGQQALALAEGGETGARGPVHLNAPFAEPLVPAPEALLEADFWAHAAGGRPAGLRLRAAPLEPSDASYEALRAFVAHHPRGAIVCGPLPSLPEAQARTRAIVALAEVLGWPILADPLSGLRFADVPQAQIMHRYDQLLAQGLMPPAPEALICLGDGPTSKALSQWIGAFEGPIAAVAAPCRPQPVHGACALLFVGDVEQTCLGLAHTLRAGDCPRAPGDHLRAWQAWQTPHQAVAPTPGMALTPGTLWPALVAALPRGAGLHVGSSMPVRDFDRFGGARNTPVRVTSSRGLNGIDGSIATAVGLAAGDGRPWVCVMGDLTFLHDVGALQNTRTVGACATLVVINNGGGQIFTKLPIARHASIFERYFRTPQEANIGLLCGACACSHEVVYTPAELGQAVVRSLGQGTSRGLHVIEARITGAQVAPPQHHA